MWNIEADNFLKCNPNQPVILVKNGKISEFCGGKSISNGSTTIIKLNPDLPEAHLLREWFDNGGGRDIPNTISSRKYEWLSFKEVENKNVENFVKPYYYKIKGTITRIDKSNLIYKACVLENCKKKVHDLGNGQYFCETCKFETANFKYSMVLNVGTIIISNIIETKTELITHPFNVL